MNPASYENPYGDDKVYDACGLFGIMDTTGHCFSGHDVVRGIVNMEERGNGLGAGFAVYGCYPEHADCYAFHVMFTRPESKPRVELYLKENFIMVHDEEVPRQPASTLPNPPLVWRYFLLVDENGAPRGSMREMEVVVDRVMQLNTAGEGAYVYSSGKNVGVFKGVGHPSQIAQHFGVEHYQGYLWTAHSRFPTNTPGWWGGAHPFGLLDWTVVHNGEISSYGTNRRYLEMQGYHCTMRTDTEVVAYAADFLMRRHELPVEAAAAVMAPPLWTEIARMDAERQALCRALRQIYAPLLINGPFTVIIARQGEMIGLTDRVRLRPLTAAIGHGGDRLYLSSEEAPIHLACPDVQRVWTPMGGEPIIGQLGTPLPVEAPIPAHGRQATVLIRPAQECIP